MKDKELLELAAKAAGIFGIDGVYPIARDSSGECYFWNPLTDDGDALRLAVKLEMHINTGSFCHWGAVTHVTTPWHDRQKLSGVHPQTHGNDPYMATRRAIVIAAAEIAKTMGE